MLTDSYEIASAVDSDLPFTTRVELKETNNEIRERASWIFIQMAKVSCGKRLLISEDIVKDLAVLFDDSIEKIRSNAYEAMLYLSEQREGCEGVVNAGTLEILVDKLISEKTERILVLTLRLIQQLLGVEQGQVRALNTPIISRVKKLCESVSSELRRLSCELLAAIGFAYPGKKRVIEQGCVGALAELLFDSISEVRASALLALACLTIEKTAKVELIEGQYLERIALMLDDESLQIRLNAIQLIANVAEHPLAKLEFQNSLDRLRELLENDAEIIKRFADRAINVITWRP
ncbi:unnamed protein product [Blepharisma stoltei]|uniref:Uncharacterized protein n=1 Tax=Blepharisma stoltei TaxID=1481888 RepID=A0AAU9JWZ8_9CILI|nr:unnamed protein product [Blepharisma stoltei]